MSGVCRLPRPRNLKGPESSALGCGGEREHGMHARPVQGRFGPEPCAPAPGRPRLPPNPSHLPVSRRGWRRCTRRNACESHSLGTQTHRMTGCHRHQGTVGCFPSPTPSALTSRVPSSRESWKMQALTRRAEGSPESEKGQNQGHRRSLQSPGHLQQHHMTHSAPANETHINRHSQGSLTQFLSSNITCLAFNNNSYAAC